MQLSWLQYGGRQVDLQAKHASEAVSDLFILEPSQFIFSEKYFSVDKFFRPYMNAEGYFPIQLLFYLPIVQSFAVDMEFLAEVLNESDFADVDMASMTVRPSKNWEKVGLYAVCEA